MVAFRSVPREEMEEILIDGGVDVEGKAIQAVLDGAQDPSSGNVMVDVHSENLLFRVRVRVVGLLLCACDPLRWIYDVCGVCGVRLPS